jgi:hypothetical protein
VVYLFPTPFVTLSCENWKFKKSFENENKISENTCEIFMNEVTMEEEPLQSREDNIIKHK